MQRTSLTVRLTTTFLMVALIGALAVGFATLRGSIPLLRTGIFGRLNAVASLKEDELNRWIIDQRQDVELLAKTEDVRNLALLLIRDDQNTTANPATAQALKRVLEPILASQVSMSEILVLSLEGGKVVYSTNPAYVGQYRISDRYFVEGQRTTYIQNMYPSPLTLKPTMTIAVPLQTTQGVTVGVLAVHLNLDRLDQIIFEDPGIGTSGETYLVDKFGDFVSSERFGRTDVARGAHTYGIDAAIRGEDGVGLYNNYRDVPVIGAYRWLDDRELVLIVEVSQSEALAPAQELAWITSMVMVAMALFITLITWLLARQIARPIQALTKATQQVAAGDLTVQAPVLTNDEIGTLAKTFNVMTGQLRQLYEGMESNMRELADTQDNLKRSEANYRSFIEHAPIGLFQIRPNGEWLHANPTLVSILGYPSAELLMQRNGMQDFFMDEEVQAYMREQIDAEGFMINLEARVQCYDGTIIWTNTSSRIVRRSDGTPKLFEGIVQDITARKLAEEEVASYREHLEEQVAKRTHDLITINTRLHALMEELRVKNAHLQHGLSLAHDIQLGLLPDHPPWDIERLIAVGRSLPSDEVGGDFYSMIQLDTNRIAVSIGDISGKGVGAALLMALTASTLEERSRKADSPLELLNQLDQILMPRLQANAMNAAVLTLMMDLTTYTIQVANAGMISPLIIRNGEIQYLDTYGLPVGSEVVFPRNQVALELQPGDDILLISDGVVEARNSAKEIWGFERLEEAVLRYPNDDYDFTLNALLQEIASWIGAAEQHDDITIVWLHVPVTALTNQSPNLESAISALK